MSWSVRTVYFCIGVVNGIVWWKMIGHPAVGFSAFGLTMLVLSLCWVSGQNGKD